MNLVARLVASLSVIVFGLGGAVGLGMALIDSSPAGADTTITVNDASDPASPNLGNCRTSPETDCSLRAALDAAAEEGGVVDITLPDPSTVPNNPTAPGGVYTVDPANGDLVLNSVGGTVNITGAGSSVSIVDAQCGVGEPLCTDNIRVLDLVNGALNVSGVTFEGGDPTATGGGDPSPGDGGGILAQSPLMLTDSTVTGNTATDEGGGIDSLGGAVTLDDSTVDLNFAGEGGGGVYSTGGNDLTINGGSVSQNQQTETDSLGGGGILVDVSPSGSSTVAISGATIDGNSAASSSIGGGGGIAIGDSDNTNRVVDIDNSQISNNVIGNSADGGGIALVLQQHAQRLEHHNCGQRSVESRAIPTRVEAGCTSSWTTTSVQRTSPTTQ